MLQYTSSNHIQFTTEILLNCKGAVQSLFTDHNTSTDYVFCIQGTGKHIHENP